ncbi:MAG: luciferase family protein, partial [Mucilaginibacter sp.]
IDDIEAEVLSWPGVYKSMHKYGGLQFNFNGRELGHIHSNGLLDIRFNRKVKQLLLAEGRAAEHHAFKKSGWISFYIRNPRDAVYAQELLKRALFTISGSSLPPKWT